MASSGLFLALILRLQVWGGGGHATALGVPPFLLRPSTSALLGTQQVLCLRARMAPDGRNLAPAARSLLRLLRAPGEHLLLTYHHLPLSRADPLSDKLGHTKATAPVSRSLCISK